MSTVSYPINKVVVIKLEDVPSFIEKFNKDIIPKDYLQTCKKVG